MSKKRGENEDMHHFAKREENGSLPVQPGYKNLGRNLIPRNCCSPVASRHSGSCKKSNRNMGKVSFLCVVIMCEIDNSIFNSFFSLPPYLSCSCPFSPPRSLARASLTSTGSPSTATLWTRWKTVEERCGSGWTSSETEFRTAAGTTSREEEETRQFRLGIQG